MAEETPTTGETPAAPATPTPPAEDVSGLKSALEKERESRKAAEKEAKRAAELEAELAKFREANQSDTEKAIEAARKEADKAARAEVQRERVIDKIEVAAAGKFEDLEDAQLHLGRRADEFIGRDGQIDTTAIAKAVDELLESKPHLAKKDPAPVPAARPGQRPTETLRAGAAPAEPERATNLYDAVAQAFQH